MLGVLLFPPLALSALSDQGRRADVNPPWQLAQIQYPTLKPTIALSYLSSYPELYLYQVVKSNQQ